MTPCSTTEVSKGYIHSNPGTTPAVVAGMNTDTNTYNVITVFNETDQHIKVSYKNANSQAADFIVPKNGRSFTRQINGGLLNTSLQVAALNSAATGQVIINLGN